MHTGKLNAFAQATLITKPTLPGHRSAQAGNQVCYGRTRRVERLQDHRREVLCIGDTTPTLRADRPQRLARYVGFMDESIAQSMARVSTALRSTVCAVSSGSTFALIPMPATLGGWLPAFTQARPPLSEPQLVDLHR